MQQITILTSEELAELQELVDMINRNHKHIVRYKGAAGEHESFNKPPDGLQRIADILGLEVKDE